MKKVSVFGGVSLDTVIYLQELPQGKSETLFSSGMREQIGSTGTGKAANLCHLGFQVLLHAQVGTDAAGEKVRRYFSALPMQTLFFDDPRGTETHVNLMDKSGSRISIYTGYNTFEPDIDFQALEQVVMETDYLVVNILNYARKIIPIGKKHGKKIWCDLHDYDGVSEYHQDFVAGADYLFLSAERMADPFRFMRHQIDAGKQLVVCTNGKKGACALNAKGEFVETGIISNYDVIDTNGAGDAFFSGFLYGHSRGASLADCMKYAAICGGLCVSSDSLASEQLSTELIESEFRVRELK